MAVYFGAARAGRHDPLARALDHGGHLTHGLKVNFSGRLYTIVHYGVSRETNLVDYDEVLRAREGAPAEADRLRRLGVSAHGRDRRVPRDRRRGRRAAPLRHGALRRARRRRAAPEPGRALRLRHLDDAQDARRAARRASSSAARSTRRRSTAPSSRACRAARSSTRSRRRRRASGSPRPSRSATTSSRCARTPTRSRRRCRRAASTCSPAAPTRISCQLDLRAHRVDGQGRRGAARTRSKLTVNRNTVPFDERPPTVASGVRIGTPAATMRGFDEDDFREVGRIIVRRARPRRRPRGARRPERRAAATRRPLYPGFRGYTTA